jgi:ligand-binding SRPBCC domain-containing protein
VGVDALWAHCGSMVGVGKELWPFLRMTYIVRDPFRAGERLFRSRLLLFGVLPVDYSDLTLVEVEPGRRFLERSPMLTQQSWEHERVLEPVAGGTQITDRLKWEGKARVLTAAYGLAVPLLFRWRHFRLQRLFGR